jgi:hypothetical protein
MLSSFWIPVSFSKTKINNVDNILFLAMTNEEIIWLHISVYKVVIMNKF